jgi:hypothetical protein
VSALADDLALRRQLYGCGHRFRSIDELRHDLCTGCASLGELAAESAPSKECGASSSSCARRRQQDRSAGGTLSPTTLEGPPNAA